MLTRSTRPLSRQSTAFIKRTHSSVGASLLNPLLRSTRPLLFFSTSSSPRASSQSPNSSHSQAFSTSKSTSKMADDNGVHNLVSKDRFTEVFEEIKADKSKLMVVDFFATWCGPCKVIAPQVQKFADQYTDAQFYKIDVDEVPEIAQEYSIRAMPTFLLFKGGEKVGEIVGANPNALETAIKNQLTEAAA